MPTPPSPTTALAQLLVDLFDKAELKRFVTAFAGRPITQTITWDGSALDAAHSVTETLDCHGLLRHRFFDRLLAEREHHSDRINALRQRYTGQAPGTERGYRRRLRHVAERVPPLFRGPSGEVLHTSRIFVQVTVHPSRHEGRLTDVPRSPADHALRDALSRPEHSVIQGLARPGKSALVRAVSSEMTLREALGQDDKLWRLQGAPGSGKSTLLKMTALGLLDEDSPRLPVLLTVTDLLAAGSLRESIARAYRKPDAVEAALQSGRAVLLLDGFDEVGNTEAAVDAIFDALDDAEGCVCLVAGRPEGFKDEPLGPDFGHLDLLPLREDAAGALLQKRLGDPTLAAQTLDRLKRDRLTDFLGNPLLLTLVAILVGRAGSAEGLPDHKVGLYGEALDWLLDKVPEERATDCLTDVAHAHACLSRVALAVHGHDGDKLDRREVERLLAAAGIAAPGALVDQLEDTTGLVETREGGGKKSWLFFSHRTIREHLAARCLEVWIRGSGIGAPLVQATLARAAKAPAVWGEVFGQTCALLGGHGWVPEGQARPAPLPVYWFSVNRTLVAVR